MLFKLLKNMSKNDIYIIFTLFITVVFFQYALALRWETLKVFDQFDVIFDTDPNQWISLFAHGEGDSYIFHPFSIYLFSIPLKIISFFAETFNLIQDTKAFREFFVPLFSPIFTGLKVISFFAILRLLKLTTIQAAFGSILAFIGFSSIIFGGIPSVYPITSFANAVMVLLAVLYVLKQQKSFYILFITTGIFATIISASNIIYVGWLYWFIYISKGENFLPALSKAIIKSGIMLTIILSSFYISSKIIKSDAVHTVSLTNSKGYIELFIPDIDRQVEKVLRFPETISKTFIATKPSTTVNLYAKRTPNIPIEIQVTYADEEFDLYSLLLTLLAMFAVGGGAIIGYQIGGMWRNLTLTSAAILFTLIMLYSVFGLYVYLYSQTWYLSCLLLISAWFTKPIFKQKYSYVVLVLVYLMMFIANVYVLEDISNLIIAGTVI